MSGACRAQSAFGRIELAGVRTLAKPVATGGKRKHARETWSSSSALLSPFLGEGSPTSRLQKKGHTYSKISSGGPTVDGRNPAPPKKPWGNHCLLVFTGSHPSRVS